MISRDEYVCHTGSIETWLLEVHLYRNRFNTSVISKPAMEQQYCKAAFNCLISCCKQIFSRRHGITSNGGNTRIIVGPSNTTTDCHKFELLHMADANWVRFAQSAVEHIKESQDGYAFYCLPISFMDVTDVLIYKFLHSLFWRNTLEPCETQASLSTSSINMVSMFHRKFNREC